MNTLMKTGLLLAVLLTLSACGGGTASVYYEVEPQYKLFPGDYFNPGYHRNFIVTGYDTRGNTYGGDYHITSEAGIYFNAEYSIPVTSTLNITADNGASTVMSNTDFFSSSPYQRYLHGSENPLSGELGFADFIYQIPEVAYPGEGGLIGEYTTSSGKFIIRNWQLADAGYGSTRLTITTSTYDTFSQLEMLTEKILIIDSLGDIDTLKLINYDAYTGVYIYLDATPA